MQRLEDLRQSMLKTEHGAAREVIPAEWETRDLPYSLAERKALGIKMLLDNMPLYIGERELVVGTRTLYGRTEETGQGTSCFDYIAMPSYVSKRDVAYFGFNHERVSKAHYTPDYGIVLELGIDGLIERVETARIAFTTPDQTEFANSLVIAYAGLKCLIRRYARYAGQLAQSAGGARAAELLEIERICGRIASEPPRNLREACQLYWFLYLAAIIENLQFVNYGRIDQLLMPFVAGETDDELTELMGCLLLKMYDQLDLVLVDKNLMGRYSAQHNITIGGVARDGRNGCNRITRAVLAALNVTRLPEPLVSIRVHEGSPDWFLRMAAGLTVSGMNCMAYYNDALVIRSLHRAGIAIEDARDYAFGLCQDILIPGRGDHYCSGGVNLTFLLLDTLKALKDEPDVDYPSFLKAYHERILGEIDRNIKAWNEWEAAVLEYNRGNRQPFFQAVQAGRILPDEPARGLNAAQAARNESDTRGELYIQTLMSPLPFTSSMYHGCVEMGTDITRCGCVNKDKGMMILGAVVAFNSLAALKKVVFEEKRYTLAQVQQALDANFQGYEVMRQRLWNAPKWCNDDDFVDQDAVELIRIATQRINRYMTPGGGHHLAGVHQPHPVFAGRAIPATPEGRLAGTPIPITISPENGTLNDGPAAAMRSCAKVNSDWIQWNSCMMLQYYSSVFSDEDGVDKFIRMLLAYYKLGGVQHQPNVVDLAKLKDAQVHPEQYRDLIIRMWGVSAHFVDLPRDVQDEFMARLEA